MIRAAGKAETKAKMAAAAKELFFAVGYSATTIRDIAKATGMSTGAFFASYASKDDLWREITGLQTPDEWAKQALADISNKETPAHD